MIKIIICSFFIFFNQTIFARTWKKIATNETVVTPYVTTAGTALTSGQCPDNFILVPKLSPYTITDFCVAKYEMKNDGYGEAISQSTGTPWVSLNRADAIKNCRALGAGFELISNNQWQTIARNITNVNSNWSSGVVASGKVNTGHTDGTPAGTLAADSADTNACAGTGQVCSNTVWDIQRRTHLLSNGNVIWDFSGNVDEFISNNQFNNNLPSSYASVLGNSEYAAAPASTCLNGDDGNFTFCGFGYVYFSNYSGGIATRGGSNGSFWPSGIFKFQVQDPNFSNSLAGFRCVYTP